MRLRIVFPIALMFLSGILFAQQNSRTIEMSKEELLKADNIFEFIKSTDPGINQSAYLVRSFTIVKASASAEAGVQISGGDFNDAAKKIFSELKSGESLAFEEIKVVKVGTKTPPVILERISLNVK